MLNRWTQVLLHRARAVLVTGIVVTIAAAGYGLGVFDSLGKGGFDDPASDAAKELVQEQEAFGNKNVDVVLLYQSKTLTADDPAFSAAVDARLERIPESAVTSVLTPWMPAGKDAGLVGDGGHAVQVLISLAGDGQDDQSDNNELILPILEKEVDDGLSLHIAGPWAVYTGVNETVSEDLARAELITLPIVLILSLLIFGSLVAAAMPVMVGAISVLGALGIVRLITNFGEVSIFSINVISLLGMGLAIDYALFIISRFREELAGLPEDDDEAPKKAMRITLGTAGRTVLFSGFTVAAAMSALLVFPQNFLRSLGYGGIAATLIGVVTALTILPAVLVLLGRRIDKGRMPWKKNKPVSTDTEHGAWARLAHAVMKRPVIVMVAIVGLLLLVASPFLGVKWGSVDYRVLPPDHPAHIAAEEINDKFVGEKSSANVLLDTTDQDEVTAYISKATAAVDVDATVLAQENGKTLLRATWAGNSQDQKSLDIVEDLRDVPGPGGDKVLIGGLSADTVDLLASIKAHLPWMAGIIIAVMMVLLFLAFGSVVLPVKAVLMNLLSISASFGVITWIFADGRLEGFLDYSSTGFLDATQPIFMLAILVGLSMDYEVFLLSRVREQWDRTAGSGMSPSERNTDAVAVGVQKTGRIITSAALLLAVVIGGFSTSGIVFMKMIGVGMLVALLVDATIVRALLVPATMKLLGRWNWWAPGPLRRFWERYGIRES
ncbi:putative membrane protein YdfJ with MMPL/SSD domain [Marmoricola sp. OAE513]|uniref:MMPL family transporter n=1 Tax=Marmoricola sp. OAE513 TaxID=2817894 RepID=UPI001AE2730C